MEEAWWQYVLAVPVGLLVIFVCFYIAILVVEYTAETVGVVVLLLFSFYIGGGFLGLF